MRAYPVIIVLWLLPCALFSQTNISGIVNSYHKVTGINYTNSGLTLDNLTGIAVNDRVMIIQMKGAAVNTTVNSSGFGSVSSLNDAGNYELATVCAVRNDSVFLLQQLLRTYTVAEKVQLVKIPRYASATVTGPLEAALWDSATGKGGVLAITVSGTLTLNATVSASAKGFKGGSFYKDGGGCATNAFQNYAYDPTPGSYFIYTNVQRGGYKGESVSDLTLSLNGGKGACANGGGGGNNHNNGGGGGSNLSSAGKGGDNLSTTGCGGQHAGIGGYALSNSSGTKIFFGGGGGAGHANNTTVSSGGGYGGGIVFIQAQTLVSNGFTISANGSDGGNTYGDGASGGGGGGTIMLSVPNYSDAVSIETIGGNGGNVDDEMISGRCYGEGGGGSGGVVYFSGLQPAGTVNIAGGAKGAKLNSTCASNTGMDGTAGSQVTNYEYVESTTLSSCAMGALDVTWLYFRANTSHNSVLLQWATTGNANSYFIVERRKEGNWIPITQMPAIENKMDYSFHDPKLLPGTYQYRLKLTSNQKISYSSVQRITIKASSQAIHYDPSTKQLYVQGEIDKNDMLRIFDFSGRCIYEKKFATSTAEWQLTASFLKTGTYIVATAKTAIKFVVPSQ
jgi:hypothetical protein